MRGKNEIIATLDAVMAQTFESYFFAECLASQDEAYGSDQFEHLCISVRIKGRLTGEFRLHTSRKAALALMASLPMPLAQISDDVICDLFAELANTIGGRVAALFAQDSFAFDLSVPTVAFARMESGEKAGVMLERCYDTDFGPIGLSLHEFIHDHAPLAIGA